MRQLVAALLRSRALFYLGTTALTFVFWWSGLTKLWDFAGAQGEMAHFGLNPPALFAALTIVVQLGGSALIVFGRQSAWWGPVPCRSSRWPPFRLRIGSGPWTGWPPFWTRPSCRNTSA